MNATAEPGYRPAQEGIHTKTIAGGAVLEGIGSIAVIALAITGLTGVYMPTMAAIAVIVLGASMLIEGGAFAASHRGEGSTAEMSSELGESLSGEFLGATAVIILGILALLNVATVTLVSVSVLVLGATLAITGLTGFGLGNRVMAGLAGVVLGLLAVCGHYSLPLVLIGLLSMGGFTLFAGAATGAKVALSHRAVEKY